MPRCDEKKIKALMTYLKYYVSSFVDESKLTPEQKLTFIKVFCYKKSASEIKEAESKGNDILLNYRKT